jgi:ribonuclease E
VIPLPAVVQEVVAGGEATAGTPRQDRPERPEGERGGRRSRRGGRRRRRDSGEAGASQEGAGESEAPEMAGDEGSPESRSFDFERTTPLDSQQPRPPQQQSRPADFVPPAMAAAAPASEPAAPPREAAPAPVSEPRQEWTPAPPSDATREGPRSEP